MNRNSTPSLVDRKKEERKKMQSTTLALSPPSHFFKPLVRTRTSFRTHTLNFNFSSNHTSPAQGPWQLGLNMPSLCSFSNSGQRSGSFNAKAASDHVDDGSVKPIGLADIMSLGAMFGIWYLLNIYFNIFNKQVLKAFPYPATVTAFQFGCGTLMVIIMWALNLHPRPNLTGSQLKAIIPLAVAHSFGNCLTNISLGRASVSFTHTIKAMEPFFTVLFSTLLLGEWPDLWVVSSLVPIVLGVALASFTEASFNWAGFCSAMASNVTNQSRNVLSKKFMVKKKETLDNISLFSIMNIISFLLLVPTAVWSEGVKFSPLYLQSLAKQGLNVQELCIRSLLSGFCFHSYQQVSYKILEMVSPVTHSVGNCAKRVVVIISSIIFFQTPVSLINAFGTAMALTGVFLYVRAKRTKSSTKVE